MNDIYNQIEAKFSQQSAAALVKNGKQAGIIATHYPKDGAGRLTVFLHVYGMTMVKGTASGYGYDKQASALESATRALAEEVEAYRAATDSSDSKTVKLAESIVKHCGDTCGLGAYDALRKVRGLQVFSAV